MNLLLATVLSALGVGAGFNGHGQRYEVLWMNPCPAGVFCKLAGGALEPNYGQALKLKRVLLAEGYRVAIIAVKS